MIDHDALQERLSFLQIDATARADLADVWRIVEPSLPRVLEGFYNHMGSVPKMAAMMGTRQTHLKKVQGEHWKRLFSGRFDEEYITSIRRIGLAHHRIGLEPRWYIGGYAFVQAELSAIVATKDRLRPKRVSRRISSMLRAIMLDMDYAISVYQEVLIEERQKRGEALSQAIASFSDSVQESLRISGEAGRALSGSTQRVAEAADHATSLAGAVATDAEQTSTNMQAGASATEELSISIREIGSQASRSADVARQAADDAQRTNRTVAGLAERADEIGQVVKLISDIAAQTNLLALNATIEAARAGEAGRGFAVVAQEVKNLAGQTAKATTEIGARITSMQDATRQSVADIQSISAVIDEVSGIATSIAAAVEEQTAATAEIARNVQDTAMSARRVVTNMETLYGSASSAREAAESVGQARDTVDKQLERLRHDIDVFLATASSTAA